MKRRIAFGSQLAVLGMIAIILIYPLFIVGSTSLKTNNEFYKNRVGLPIEPQFDNYAYVFQKANIASATFNSFLIMAISVIGLLVIGSLASYAITKMGIKRSDDWARMFLLPMAFSAQVVITPLFTMFRVMGLMNSIWAVILIDIATFLPLTIYILSKFMMTVPGALSEAARIDGANHLTVYSRIIMPLCKVPVTTLVVINGMYVWNDFFVPFMFISDPSRRTLPLTLVLFQQQFKVEWPDLCAAIIFTIAPMLIMYAFLQKYIIAGVGAGALKG
ncbi:MAG: carbohydrate ABC transporter permease [Clostridiales bacterium]|nr:carbohydrate ABC transporter permease [Clostridiales bacterium]